MPAMNDAPAKMRRSSSRWTLAAILVLCLRGACNGFVAPGWGPASQRGFKPASISLPTPGPARRPQSAREALVMPISGAGEALATVLVSEVGDKTFFLTMILAMRSSRRLALLSSQSALWVMMFVSTSIGVMLRRLTLTVSSGSIIRWTAAALMILFGLQSFRETMGGDQDDEEDEGEKGDAQSEIDGVLHKASLISKLEYGGSLKPGSLYGAVAVVFQGRTADDGREMAVGASPTGDSDLAAFAYSPTAERQETGGRDRDVAPRGLVPAFYQEALPAQPERPGGAGPVEPAGQMRGFGGASTATMNWMARLGDFPRTQVQGGMETRTTMTRQQVVGSRELGGLVVQQEQLQHTTSQPASPTNHLYPSVFPSPAREGMGEGELDPPLFGAGARRVMEGWAQRAPLLHGVQRTQQGPGTDAGSTGSIPREMVQEEVRRQVQEALEGQRRSLERLQEEFLEMTWDSMVYQAGIGLHLCMRDQTGIGLHLCMVYQTGIGLHLRLMYQTGIGLHLCMVYQTGIGLHLCMVYQTGIGLHLRIMYQTGIGLHLCMVYQTGIGLHLCKVYQAGILRGISNQLFRVVEYLRGISSQLFRVVEYLRRINSQLFRVVEYLRGISSQLFRVVEYLRGISSLLPRVVEYLRTSSLDRRTSPLGRTRRKSSSSPSGLVEGLGPASFSYGVTGLLDGDGYSFPQNERVYRQPVYQETKTFGDYDVSAPPGLGPSTEKTAEAPGPAFAGHSTAPTACGAADREPNPLEVLITGMTQLQQLLLKKGEGLDVESKGMPELPKLSEYNPETGAIEFQDYLYLVEQQIGSLASGAGEWWQKTLEVAQVAYTEYQALSPVKRLGVKAQLTVELKEERYRRLEKKVAAMLLSSLPKGVKDDLIAYRVQGVHQILYRLMVIFQPGGAQDRAQLLRQLDISESAAGPSEAVVSIRRWYRLLQRASDLGVTLPDESLQVKSLNAIVKKTAEQNSDFKFRLALARTELQIDTRPNQGNVLKYMQHLLAELEQLGSLVRRPAVAPSTTAPTTSTTAAATTPAATGSASLKGLQGSDPPPKGNGKAKAPPGKKLCQWFSTDSGCRNGRDCTFQHTWTGLNRSERCILCGSKQHRAKECTAGKAGSSPERGNNAQAAKAAGAAPSLTPSLAAATPKDSAQNAASAPATSSTTSGPTSTANKMDPSQMSEMLAETNKMLKALTAKNEAPVAPTSVDPLTVIQQQLDEVRRLKVLRVHEPSPDTCAFGSAVEWYEARLHATTLSSASATLSEEEEALLDSGASHPFRPQRSSVGRSSGGQGE
ncbi:unnamed protein product [Symbiodinium sp. CCMP2592]|nr:unnamed protein product [Symbiodinium sp. CCMP2592]